MKLIYLIIKYILLAIIVFCLLLLFNIARANTKGKAIYNSSCIVCHNSNPSKVGAIGPNLVPSSLELIKAKLISGTYPKGYKPRRNTKIMPLFKYNEEQLKSLQEYIKGFK